MFGYTKPPAPKGEGVLEISIVVELYSDDEMLNY